MDEYITLDQLEDLVAEMLKAVNRRDVRTQDHHHRVSDNLLAEYYNSGGYTNNIDRYDLLRRIYSDIIDKFETSAVVGLDSYVDRYGPLPRNRAGFFEFIPDDILNDPLTPLDAPIFTAVNQQLQRGFQGPPSEAGTRSNERTFDGPPGEFGTRDQNGPAENFDGVETDPFLDQFREESVSESVRLSNQRAKDNRDSRLAALARQEAERRAQFALQNRQRDFTVAAGLRQGVLTATQGNINSGLRQGQRNVSVTANGFDAAASQIAFDADIASIQAEIADTNRQYSQGVLIDNAVRQEALFADLEERGAIPTPASEYTATDFVLDLFGN